MVGRVGRADFGVVVGVGQPVEGTAVDERAADRRARAVNPLRRRLPDKVRAVFQRTTQRWRGKCVVDEQRCIVLVSDVGDAFKIRGDERGVADGFEMDVGSVLVNGVGVGVVIEGVDEAGCDPTAFDAMGEVGVGAAVQR